MLEKMEMQFEDDGTPSIQLVISSADSKRVRAQINALTPAQHLRIAEIIIRKREAYFASRRRRRLSRHCH